MDIKQVQELIKLVSKSSLSELTIEEGEFKITLKQKDNVVAPAYVSAPMVAAPMTAPAVAAPAPAPTPAAPAQPTGGGEDTSKYITIKSPMIGTFYRRPAPDKPLYVEVGDEVNPGKVVCIIEAMKLFNEIESEVKGRIVKVLAEDQTPVEYDQPLYLVDPS